MDFMQMCYMVMSLRAPKTRQFLHLYQISSCILVLRISDTVRKLYKVAFGCKDQTTHIGHRTDNLDKGQKISP